MLRKTNIIIAAGVALGLAGCQSFPQPIEISSKPVQLTIIQPVDPEPVTMINVHVSVVNKNNLDAFVKKAAAEQGTENPVFVAMGTKDYEGVALNIAELKRYIVQQQQIIAYYRKATATEPAAQPPAK
jgi:hypothetical protein